MTPRKAEPVDLMRLIEALSRPEAYPFDVDAVELHQTHISCVFLAGAFAYKLKKPIDLGFVDYRRLEDRVRFCEEELRINRRLAPHVYLDLTWVRARGGGLFFFGDGEPVEVAVRMQRLPDEAMFSQRLRSGRAEAVDFEHLAELLVPFYRAAERGPTAALNASPATVIANARENFGTLEPFMATSDERAALAECRSETERLFAELSPLIEQRSRSHACETHGDLRLEHVYRLGEGPSGLVVIDAVEFSERFRFADPAADLAFLVMELRREGRSALADHFLDRYVRASGDEEVRLLIPFYVAYRALVRAKIRYLKTLEPELPAQEREAAPARARGHIELARASLRAGRTDTQDGA